MSDRERVEPAVAHNLEGACARDPFDALAFVAVTRGEREREQHGAGGDERRHVRGPPVEQRRRHGHDRDREPSPADAGGAVQALRGRGPHRGADVVAPGDEADSRADPRNQTSHQRHRERRLDTNPL